MKKVSKHILLPEEINDKLLQFDNQTEIIIKALNMYMSNKSVLVMKIAEQKSIISDLEYQLKEAKILLSQFETELEEEEEKNMFRPESYLKTVDVLRSIKRKSNVVSRSSLKYQAEQCDVDVDTYKRWLFDDGYMDELWGM